MLIVFDVDGTLLGGESHDWACFDSAIHKVTGFKPTREFFRSLPEITAQAIAEAAIRVADKQPGNGLEEQIRDEFLGGLREVCARDPSAFQPREGVVALLEHLGSAPGIGVAIATGDWEPTIRFKLDAAGIDVSRIPMATCSDVSRRSEIIKLAAQRAGRSLDDVVYIGDGIWDFKACRELGVRFVGTGSRLNLLKEAGVQHMIEIFESAAFLSLIKLAMQATKL